MNMLPFSHFFSPDLRRCPESHKWRCVHRRTSWWRRWVGYLLYSPWDILLNLQSPEVSPPLCFSASSRAPRSSPPSDSESQQGFWSVACGRLSCTQHQCGCALVVRNNTHMNKIQKAISQNHIVVGNVVWNFISAGLENCFCDLSRDGEFGVLNKYISQWLQYI